MERTWLAFSSLTFTALLGIAFAVFAGLTAFVPQGWLATQLAGLEHTEMVRALHVWGLTDIASSSWLFALGALLVGNLLALGLRIAFARAELPEDAVLHKAAPFRAELSAPFPERAVEGLRGTLAGLFGRPVREAVDGPRVTLAFETAPRARWTPLLSHVGLLLLMLGAVLATRPAPRNQSMVRTVLEVRDSRSPSVGIFDMAQDEARTFFQWQAEYIIREYTPQRLGLGPAVRMDRVGLERAQNDSFWIYLDAPPNFDKVHRGGLVSIMAREMGLVPRPGAGLASRPEGVLLLLGLGLLAVGLLELGRPEGRLVVHAHGRQISLAGVPRRAGDRRFAVAFERWILATRWSLGL